MTITTPIAYGLTSLALGSPLEDWRPRRIAVAGVRFATGAETIVAGDEAAAKATADKAAADQKAADDKAAADAKAKAEGDKGKTPEQLAAEKKTADDKAAADKKAADDKAAADAEAAKNGKGKEGDEGQPKAPDKYELKVPDDAKHLITPIVLKAHEALARANNWTNEEAQSDLEARIELTRDGIAEQRAAYLETTKADPDYGGQHLEASTKLARAGVNAIRPAGHARREAFIRLLNDTGIGDHVEAVAFFADLGKLVGEDSPNLGRHGAQKEEVKPTPDVLFPSSAGAAKP